MLPRFFRSVRPFGRTAFRRSTNFFRVSTRWQYLKQATAGYGNHILLEIRMQPIPDPPNFPPELLAGIRTHVKKDFTFKAKTYTYLEAEWNPIFLQLELPPVPRITTVTVEPGARERLLQFLAACAPGTYGYYANMFLGKVAVLVGNLASANIDQLFIAMAPFVNQPIRRDNEKLMNIGETQYWDTREDLINWLAGQILGVKSRGWATRFAEACSKPVTSTGLAPERVFSEEQIAEATERFTKAFDTYLGELDPLVVRKLAEELADEFIKKNQDKIKAKTEL